MPKAGVPVEKRAAEFKNDGIYASAKTLFCKWCNCRLDHERRDTLVKHCASEKHRRIRDAAEASSSRPTPTTSTPRQISLEETLSSSKKIKIDREEFIMETAEAFLSANIPPEKLDNPQIRAWMAKHVKGAGDIPSANNIRRKIIPKLGDKKRSEIKANIKDKDIILMTDETTDKGGRCVYNILCKTLEPGASQSIHLLASVVLDSADSASCAKAVIDTLAQYEVNYDNVIAFVSDAARYMTKCYTVLSGLIEHLIHIQCWAHKVHLVGVIWQESLEELNRVIVKVKSAFLNTRKRKTQYAKHLGDKYGEKSGKVRIIV